MSGRVRLLVVGCLLLAVAALSGAEKDIPPPTKLGHSLGVPTLKFLYCYSCGFRKAFQDYASMINKRYPDITVIGQNYDPPATHILMTKIIGLLKILGIICILGGIDVFNFLNQPQPGWWRWCLENKMYTCIMIFFLSNIVEGHLMSSGAFEISLNDVPVWSKLETGRVPHPSELFNIIDSHLQFTTTTIDHSTGFAK